MHRTIAALTIAAALTFGAAGPAAAEYAPPPGSVLIPRDAIPPSGRPAAPAVPPCVTTNWRADYTGQPKTPRGHICYGTPSMWIPATWTVVDRVWARGAVRPVYERPLHG